jgi:tRNA (cmo5U34)-methyltransferase
VDLYHRDASSSQTAMRHGGPDHDRLYDVLVGATGGIGVRSILDLGSGTGETSLRVIARHSNARLVALDASPDMAERTADALAGYDAEVLVGQLEEALPGGPFDLVVSAFAVHHLDAGAKALLFRRIAEALRPGGRLVLADTVLPETALALLTPLEESVDHPAPLHELVDGLRAAGLSPAVRWRRANLVVLSADRPGEMELPSVGAVREAPRAEPVAATGGPAA